MESDSSLVNDNASAASEDSMDQAISREKNMDIGRFRMLMVVFDLLLSHPRWSFTLFLFIASLITPPFENIHDSVLLPYYRLQSLVNQEANAYSECVVDAFVLLGQDLIEAADRERDNVLQQQASNLQLLQEVEQTTNECYLAALKAKDGLYQWGNRLEQHLPFINSSASNCSSEDQSYISTSLGEDFQKVETEVSSIVGDYRHQSETSFGLVRDYAEQRSDYDYDYFLRNRIEPALQLLEELSNRTFHTVQLSMDARLAIDELLILVDVFKSSIADARLRFGIAMERLQEFYDHLQVLYDNYHRLYDRALQMINVSNPWLLEGGLLHSLDIDVEGVEVFKLNGILTVDPISLLPPNFYMPQFDEFTPIDLMFDDFANEATRVISNLVEVLAKEAAAILQSTAKELLEQIRAQLTLEDYSPPQFQGSKPQIQSLDDETEFLFSVGETAEENTRVALDRVHLMGNATTPSEIPSDIPEVDATDHSFSGNSTTFAYQELEIPEFTTFAFFAIWLAKLLGLAWAAELGLQVARVFLKKSRYERDAKPELPEVSFGAVENETEDEDDEDFWIKRLLFLLSFLLNLMQRGVFLAFAIATLVLLNKIWYPHVVENCVESNNGTSVANNLLTPWATNQASAPGNVLYKEKELACRNRQRRVCDSMLTESEIAYRDDLAALSNFQHTQNQSLSMTARFERCIDMQVLDKRFRDACCGLEGYSSTCLIEPLHRTHRCPIDDQVNPAASFSPIGSYLTETACLADPFEWKLENSRFDCQSLEDGCSNAPCTGVDGDLIHSMVVEADCLAELAAIRVVFYCMLALYNGVMINWMCMLWLKGTRVLLWKRLNPYGLRFSTQMDEHGNLLKGNSAQMREELVLTAINKVQVPAFISWCLGWLCFTVWIVSLFFFPDLGEYQHY